MMSVVECVGLVSSDADHHASLSTAELYIQRHDVVTDSDY